MTFTHLYASSRLALWHRIVLFALDHDGEVLARGQLLRAVDPQRLTRSAEVTRAVRIGVTRGMLQPGSTCAMLRFAHAEEEAA